MNIESFVPLDHFRKTTGGILRELRAYSKAQAGRRIYTAGEKAYIQEMRAKQEGIRIPPSVQKMLKTLCLELGVSCSGILSGN
jgi:LDH2 family malate/lactate/ureidoglycolate dehydrogenase